MKRIGNLYEKIISVENLVLANEKARKGKKDTYGVQLFDINSKEKIEALHESLQNETFKTSKYHIFKIIANAGKEREIFRLPYYPDRIVHHAIMNIMQPIWTKLFISHSYSCIKGKGIHGALFKLKNDLRKNKEETKYCLKLDLKKFYPSIDHGILKNIIKKKVKDAKLLNLLHEIINSAPGVPIGNYLSQYFANLYLTYFDHYVKETLQQKFYYRYADDIVILSESKEKLRETFLLMQEYLNKNLNLTIKGNHQIFPVETRGIDFVGYVIRHDYILLRKSIKKRFAKAIKKRPGSIQIHSAYYGWAKHCNSKNLIKKLAS